MNRPGSRGKSTPARALIALCAVAAVVSFAAPADRAEAQTGSATPVDIPDPALRAKLESSLSKSSGETITRAEMATLRNLRLQNAYADRNNPNLIIRDLTGLEYATGVVALFLEYNGITDLSPLAGLTQLSALSLNYNRISDLSPLAGLPYLRTLNVHYNLVSDLSPLARMTSLTTLGFNSNQITDLSPLAGLTNLTYLTITRNRVSDLGPLARLTSLVNLFLGNNRIMDLTPLRGLTSLEYLHIYNNEVRDLGPLTGLSGLNTLSAGSNRIGDLSPLVASSAWGPGDRIDLRDNPDLGEDDATDVGTLRGRGAEVFANSPLGLNRTVRGVRVIPGVRQLKVAWRPLTAYDPTGYLVQWKSGTQLFSRAATPPRHEIVLGAGTTTFTIPGLTPGVEYAVRVRPHGKYGDPSNPAWGTPLAAPAGPVRGEVTVTPGVESLIVSWRAVGGAEGYRVRWRRSGDPSYEPADQRTTGDTTDTIPGLVGGTEYTLRVFTLKTGARDGGPSAEASGTPRLGRAANVRAEPGVEHGSLAVSWDPVAGADGYKVQWRSGEQDHDPDERQGTTAVTATDPGRSFFLIRGLAPGVPHQVRVIATRTQADDGPPSEEAAGTPSEEEVVGTPPADEENVLEVEVTDALRSLVVSWRAVPGADHYQVRWRRSGAQGFDPADRACVYVRRQTCVSAPRSGPAGSGQFVTWTITGLEADVEYVVFVTPVLDDDPLGPPTDGTGTPFGAIATIKGAAGGGAAAVTVDEGDDARLLVVLDRPTRALVTVAWATEDGTAKAGEDYTASRGVVTFQPGEAEAALRVPTLQDRQAEPDETFRVRLMEVANAQRGSEAASATVTIRDDEAEARGRALGMVLAGMGRWVAADAVDVIEARFTPSEEGARVAVGGRTLELAAPGAAAGDGRGVRWDGLVEALVPQGGEEGGVEPPSAAELLARSWFDLPLTPQDGPGAGGGTPALRVWGRGSAGGFDGRPQAGLTMDGDVVAGYLGFDYRPRRDALVGVAVAHTEATVDYTAEGAGADGEVDLGLTSVLPYVHFSPRADFEVWGLLGAGGGDAELQDESGKVETGLKMWMAAAGLQQDVAAWREIDLALKIDGFLTEMKAAAGPGLPAAEGDAKRVRVRLEGRRQWEISPAERMTPSVELGGRWDGGSAEKGLGMEVGGAVAYTHTDLGLEVEAQGRVLLAHRESAFDEWGGSLTVKLDPGRAERGPWMKLAPGWGAEGSRVAQLWNGREAFRAPGAADEAPGLSPDRLDLDVGYGSASGGVGLLTPYAGLSIKGSDARRYKVGTRLEVDDRLDLGVEGRRSVRGNGRQGDEVVFFGRIEW